MTSDAPMLLILDLDDTLIHDVEDASAWGPDFQVGPYAVKRRPHLDAFLRSCARWSTLAFWSTATDAYVEAVVARILPEATAPAFVWGRSRCSRRFDPETFEDVYLKDLKKVRRRGFALERTLIVDDTPSKVARQYGNAVYIPAFLGDPTDDVLPRLGTYLATLHAAPDVRIMEKRGWLQSDPA